MVLLMFRPLLECPWHGFRAHCAVHREGAGPCQDLRLEGQPERVELGEIAGSLEAACDGGSGKN